MTTPTRMNFLGFHSILRCHAGGGDAPDDAHALPQLDWKHEELSSGKSFPRLSSSSITSEPILMLCRVFALSMILRAFLMLHVSMDSFLRRYFILVGFYEFVGGCKSVTMERAYHDLPHIRLGFVLLVALGR